MKYETMLKILFLLLAKGKVSAKYIAQRFDISTRTVMRYLDTMSLANIPILSDPGRNGGFYIADTYKLPAGFMTEKEFNAVISALANYNENVGSKTISSAINKLSAIKSPKARSVEVKSDNLLIDASSWNGNDNVKNVISLISESIEEKTQVIIGYVDKSGKQTVRTVEPHVILLKQGLWYVYAFCNMRNSFRMFKASRIRFANANGVTFERRKVDLTALSNGKWFEHLPSEQIELEISPSAKTDVEEWLGVDKVYSSSGKYYASASLPYDEWLISKILSFAGKVKALSPQKLKNDLLIASKNVTALYE